MLAALRQFLRDACDRISERKGGDHVLKNSGQVLFRESADELIITVGGEIDHHSAVTVRAKVDEKITLCRPKQVYMELSGVDFMDSSGLGLIMGRYALVTRQGGTFAVLDPSNAVMKMMKLAGMERMIKIVRRQRSV